MSSECTNIGAFTYKISTLIDKDEDVEKDLCK
jgi:hypothetical protein